MEKNEEENEQKNKDEHSENESKYSHRISITYRSRNINMNLKQTYATITFVCDFRPSSRAKLSHGDDLAFNFC